MASDDRLLHVLKSRGAQRAAALGDVLGISASAVRQKLAALADQGLVAFEDRRESTGRPKRYWHLTASAHGRFPDAHAQLTDELIRSVRTVFGDDGLEALIAERERASLAGYRKALAAARSLEERVVQLAKLRAAEGYMAEATQADDGSWLLVEHHCPICVAAAACQGFCRSEQAIFAAVLGRGVRVEREDHILAGARRCAYRIRRVARGRAMR